MKRILFSIGLSLLAFTSNAQMTATEIIDNYFANIGGREAWSALKGHKITAEINMGMVLPIDMYMMKDGRSRISFKLQGQEMVQEAFDGESVWSTNFASMTNEKADTEESENRKRSIGEYPDPFLNVKEGGFTAEYIGEETVEGVKCYKVKLIKTPILVDGVETENSDFYYFDQENFVPIMTESVVHSGPAKGKTALSVYSDYQEVDGLYFPFSITYKTKSEEGQTIEIKSIELNPVVTDELFDFPGE